MTFVSPLNKPSLLTLTSFTAASPSKDFHPTLATPLPLFSPEDTYLSILTHAGVFTNEFGILKKELILAPLPPLSIELEQHIEKEFLDKPILIALQVCGVRFTITPRELFEDLEAFARKSDIPIEDIQLVGSALPWFLGFDYFVKTFAHFGIDLSALLPPDIQAYFKQKLQQRPNDVDIRFYIPKTQVNYLKLLNQEVMRILAVKMPTLTPEQKLAAVLFLKKNFGKKYAHITEKEACLNSYLITELAFSKFCIVSDPQKSFSLAGFGNSPSLPLEVIFVQNITKLFTSTHNSLTLSIKKLLHKEKGSKAPLFPLGDPFTRANGLQALSDLLAGIVTPSDPHSQDDADWDKLLAGSIKKRRCLYTKPSQILLENVLKRARSSGSVVYYFTHLLTKSFQNHHRNHPPAILAITAEVQHLLADQIAPDELKAILGNLRTYSQSVKRSGKTAETELGNALVTLFNTPDFPLNTLWDFLQVVAFIQLSAPSDFCAEQQITLTHEPKGLVVYIPCEGVSIKVPFDPLKGVNQFVLYREKSSSIETGQEPFQAMQEVLTAFFPATPWQGFSSSPLVNYQHLMGLQPRSFDFLMSTCEAFLQDKSFYVQQLGYYLALALNSVHHRPLFIEKLILLSPRMLASVSPAVDHKITQSLKPLLQHPHWSLTNQQFASLFIQIIFPLRELSPFQWLQELVATKNDALGRLVVKEWMAKTDASHSLEEGKQLFQLFVQNRQADCAKAIFLYLVKKNPHFLQQEITAKSLTSDSLGKDIFLFVQQLLEAEEPSQELLMIAEQLLAATRKAVKEDSTLKPYLLTLRHAVEKSNPTFFSRKKQGVALLLEKASQHLQERKYTDFSNVLVEASRKKKKPTLDAELRELLGCAIRGLSSDTSPWIFHALFHEKGIKDVFQNHPEEWLCLLLILVEKSKESSHLSNRNFTLSCIELAFEVFDKKPITQPETHRQLFAHFFEILQTPWIPAPYEAAPEKRVFELLIKNEQVFCPLYHSLGLDEELFQILFVGVKNNILIPKSETALKACLESMERLLEMDDENTFRVAKVLLVIIKNNSILTEQANFEIQKKLCRILARNYLQNDLLDSAWIWITNYLSLEKRSFADYQIHLYSWIKKIPKGNNPEFILKLFVRMKSLTSQFPPLWVNEFFSRIDFWIEERQIPDSYAFLMAMSDRAEFDGLQRVYALVQFLGPLQALELLRAFRSTDGSAWRMTMERIHTIPASSDVNKQICEHLLFAETESLFANNDVERFRCWYIFIYHTMRGSTEDLNLILQHPNITYLLIDLQAIENGALLAEFIQKIPSFVKKTERQKAIQLLMNLLASNQVDLTGKRASLSSLLLLVKDQPVDATLYMTLCETTKSLVVMDQRQVWDLQMINILIMLIHKIAGAMLPVKEKLHELLTIIHDRPYLPISGLLQIIIALQHYQEDAFICLNIQFLKNKTIVAGNNAEVQELEKHKKEIAGVIERMVHSPKVPHTILRAYLVDENSSFFLSKKARAQYLAKLLLPLIPQGEDLCHREEEIAHFFGTVFKGGFAKEFPTVLLHADEKTSHEYLSRILRITFLHSITTNNKNILSIMGIDESYIETEGGATSQNQPPATFLGGFLQSDTMQVLCLKEMIFVLTHVSSIHFRKKAVQSLLSAAASSMMDLSRSAASLPKLFDPRFLIDVIECLLIQGTRDSDAEKLYLQASSSKFYQKHPMILCEAALIVSSYTKTTISLVEASSSQARDSQALALKSFVENVCANLTLERVIYLFKVVQTHQEKIHHSLQDGGKFLLALYDLLLTKAPNSRLENTIYVVTTKNEPQLYTFYDSAYKALKPFLIDPTNLDTKKLQGKVEFPHKLYKMFLERLIAYLTTSSHTEFTLMIRNSFYRIFDDGLLLLACYYNVLPNSSQSTSIFRKQVIDWMHTLIRYSTADHREQIVDIINWAVNQRIIKNNGTEHGNLLKCANKLTKKEMVHEVKKNDIKTAIFKVLSAKVAR